MFRTTLSAVTAVLATAVAGVVVPAGGASGAAPAPACSGDTGVTVIVDFNELGGGITAGCDPNGGGRVASDIFRAAGYALTFVQQDPGFTCRVSGKPADNPCVRTPPATAYWSLWWSDGESGRWSYATTGVNALEVPDGGFVAFAWHEGQQNAGPPDASPVRSAPEPTDDGDNGGGDGGGNGGGGNGNGGGGDGGGGDEDDNSGAGSSTDATATTSALTTTAAPSSRATGSTSPEERRKRRDRETVDPSATSSSGTTVPAAGEITAGPPESDLGTEAPGDDGGALPTWIGLGLAVLVLGAAGLVTVLRRRTG